ncbi:MAG: hypothetical protein J6B75_03365 [Ruminococcus sp.]|nr:hypothetical protein [Ruminococcus sp.]
MKSKDGKKTPVSEDDKLHISKSVFETNREMHEKAAEEARQKQEELEKKIAERKKKAAEARDKRLEAERLELIRLKQGVIEESETIHEEHEEEVKLNFRQKIVNFFYHNKWWLGIGTVFTAIAVFLTYNLITKPRPDIVVLIIGESYEIAEESDLKGYVESFCEDFNGNGKVEASIYYIPYTGIETKDYTNGVHTKLTAELQAAEGVIVIGNNMASDILSADGIFTDLSQIYSDNELIEKDRFMLSDSNFADRLGITKTAVTNDWFMAIRAPQDLMNADMDDMQEVYDKDFPVFDAMIKDLTK